MSYSTLLFEYKTLLNDMKKGNTESASSYFTHPRNWVPPPCKTSPPQKIKSKSNESELVENNQIFDANVSELIKQLEKDKKMLKEAEKIVVSNGNLPRQFRSVIHKWNEGYKKDKLPATRERKVTDSKHVDNRTKKMYPDKQRTTRAKSPQPELKHHEPKNETFETPVKRKVKRKTKNERRPKKMSKCRKFKYKYLVMQRKHNDLLSHLAKMEEDMWTLRQENQRIKSFYKTSNAYSENKSSSKSSNSFQNARNTNNSGGIPETSSENTRNTNKLNELPETPSQNRQNTKNMGTRNVEDIVDTNQNEDSVDSENWIFKLQQMRNAYENAISGYKEELRMTITVSHSLQDKVEVLKNELEREKNLTAKYEQDINKLNDRLLNLTSESFKNEKFKDNSEVKEERPSLNEKRDFEHIEYLLKSFDEKISNHLQKFVQNCPSQAQLLPENLSDTLKTALRNWWIELNEDKSFDINKSMSEIELVQNLNDTKDYINISTKESTTKPTITAHSVSSEPGDVPKITENEVIDELKAEIMRLQDEIYTKDKILEDNSKSLENRIREYSYVASQLDKVKLEHSKEINRLQSLATDVRLQPTIQELQLQKDKVQYQLNFLKKDREITDRTNQKRIRTLESQNTHLKMQNSTLTIRLQRIQNSYESLFQSVGSLQPQLSVPIPPLLHDLNT